MVRKKSRKRRSQLERKALESRAQSSPKETPPISGAIKEDRLYGVTDSYMDSFYTDLGNGYFLPK